MLLGRMAQSPRPSPGLTFRNRALPETLGQRRTTSSARQHLPTLGKRCPSCPCVHRCKDLRCPCHRSWCIFSCASGGTRASTQPNANRPIVVVELIWRTQATVLSVRCAHMHGQSWCSSIATCTAFEFAMPACATLLRTSGRRRFKK